MAAANTQPQRRGHQRTDTLNKFARFEQDFNRNALKRSNSATLTEDFLALLQDQAPEEKNGDAPRGQSVKRIWECGVCTFHNNTHMRYCEICGVMRDANTRDQQMSPITSPEASPNPPLGDDTDLYSFIQTNNKSREERPVSRSILTTPPHPHHRAESTPAVVNYIPSKPKPRHADHRSHRRTNSIPHPLQDSDESSTSSTTPRDEEPLLPQPIDDFDPLASPEAQVTNGHRDSVGLSAFSPISVTGPAVVESSAPGSPFWTCAICTFAENRLDVPVCAMCSALPPEAPPSPEPNSDQTWEALGGGPPPPAGAGVARTGPQRRPSRELDLIGGQQFDFPEAMPTPQPVQQVQSAQPAHPRPPKQLPPKARRRAQSEQAGGIAVPGGGPNANLTVRSPRERGGPGFVRRLFNRLGPKTEDGQVPELMKKNSMALPSELNEDARDKPFSIATISPEKRQKLVKKLEKLETKKDLLNYLDQTIVKVRDKLQKHVTCLLQYKKQLDKTKAEFEADSRKWSEFCIRQLERKAADYFSNRILFYTTCHDVEKMYADCFSEKLKKLKHAKQKIDRNKRHYSIDDMRANIETAFDIAWRIRISDTVPEKQELLRDLRQIIDAEKEEYKSLKAQYDVEVGLEQRTKRVRVFLDKTLRVVSERRMGAMKARRKEREREREMSLRDDESESVVSSIDGSDSGHLESSGVDDDDDFYYHEHDVDKQDDFNCFLLDRRMREGRIIHKWLLRQEDGQDEPSLESVSQFLRRLTATFCDSYGLDEETYYSSVELFLYRCLFVHDRFSVLVSTILYNETEITLNDELFLKKTFWMRSLKQAQLGIEEQFRMEHDSVSIASILNSIEAGEDDNSLPPPMGGVKARKPSSLALVAGSDMPYAIAINIFGEIRKAVNPHQVLRILLQAVKCINATASTYAREKGSRDFVITGDSLFPIVVYCVVQCGLEEPHKHILLLETMLPKQSTYGAGAFALSVIKAAVSYILQANPVDFGLPAEIEA